MSAGMPVAGPPRRAGWFCAAAFVVAWLCTRLWLEIGPVGCLAMAAGATAAAWLGGLAARRLGGRDHGWRAALLTGAFYSAGLPLAYVSAVTVIDFGAVAEDPGDWLGSAASAVFLMPFVAAVAVPVSLAGGALFQLGVAAASRLRRSAAG